MHVHKNYTDAFKKKLRPPLEYGRDFFLFPVFSLQNFYMIPVKFLSPNGALIHAQDSQPVQDL